MAARPRDWTVEPEIFAGLVKSSDAALLAIAVAVAASTNSPSGPMAIAGIGASLTTLAVAQRTGVYRFGPLTRPMTQVGRLSAALLAGLVVFGVLLVTMTRAGNSAAPAPISAGLIAWLASAAGLLVVSRAGVVALTRRWVASGRLTRRIAVIGANPMGFALADRIAAQPHTLDRVVGIFDETEVQAGNTAEISAESGADRRVLGRVSDLLPFSQIRRVDRVIVAVPQDRAHTVPAICEQLRCIVADVCIAPDMTAMPGKATQLVHVASRPLTGWSALQKAAFDRVVAAILLLMLSPLLALIIVAIKLDSPGPIFFRQPRMGFNNLHFTVFKFRSMRHDMSDLLADKQTDRHDPRVTRVGKWLRKLSLDELPQLLNVLQGSMSLVGPRPHAPNTRAAGLLLEDAVARYAERHRILPGMTGWAQINGARGAISTVAQAEKRVRLDLEYIENWSLLFDIRIIVLTAMKEIVSRHAF